MKGTEKIIAHIQADAKSAADAILAQAEQQCAGIREDYEKKANEAYAEKIRAGVKLCEADSESKSRIAEMESKKEILALKQEMVSKGFDKAREMILNLPEEEYKNLLVKLAVRSSSTGDEQVILSAKDKAKFGETVINKVNSRISGGKLSLSETDGDFDGGLILKRGNIEINSTLALLIDLCRSDMAAELAKILFS